MKTIKVSDETTIADTTKKHFINISNKLELKPTETETNELTLSEIQSQMNDDKNLFSFKSITSKEVLKTISLSKTTKDH